MISTVRSPYLLVPIVERSTYISRSKRVYIRYLSQLVLLDRFCNLIDLVGDILRSGGAIAEIILYSKVGIGTYSY
jgi:hypothetical protein